MLFAIWGIATILKAISRGGRLSQHCLMLWGVWQVPLSATAGKVNE
jgi:hypothetical protein